MSMFQLHEKFNSLLYSGFNICSEIVFRAKFDLQKSLRRNSDYRNVHKGERCFIMGTGPSLNNLTSKQVEILRGEVTFGVNSIYKAAIIDPIIPKYYALMDNNYWGKNNYAFSDIHKKYENNLPIFITDVRAKRFVPQDMRAIFLYAKNYPTHIMRYDLTKNISITMNVVGFSILSAMYMGFKEIYLLGCDYNSFCHRLGHHCYDDTSEYESANIYNLAFHLKYYHLTTEFHYLIARTARQTDIKIVNLSEGSLLDAYPGKSIADVLRVN